MQTKNIFKALAMAMLMPAMLLTTACSNDDDFVTNNKEQTIKKGFELPVTVNVTRQDDATRATYNDGTKTLSFSTGDKLLVNGQDTSDGGAGYFAGILDYDDVSGKFSGTITTEKAYTGTADALFTAAYSSSDVSAILLPAGYEDYGFLEIDGTGYEVSVTQNTTYTFATSKAAAVEQFSCEIAESYSDGFALAPMNAILNFTITGLPASTNVDVSLTGGYWNITRTVTTDSDGKAVFGTGVDCNSSSIDFNYLFLTVGGNTITLASGSKILESGKIYNITRSASALLHGIFSVGTTTKVKFSKSNLRYESGAWSFFPHQYDYYSTYSADAWDKFGWSNSTNNFGMTTSTTNTDYFGALVDWGTVPGIGSGWRTLSLAEWQYLFSTRSASTVNSVANARYAKGKVNNVYGIILFPDTYTHPDGVTNPVGINATDATGWNGNNYNATDWGKMEAAGCVFLPAAGYRNGASLSECGSGCSYRSTTPGSTDPRARYIYFDSNALNLETENLRRYGQCVRLVHE